MIQKRGYTDPPEFREELDAVRGSLKRLSRKYNLDVEEDRSRSPNSHSTYWTLTPKSSGITPRARWVVRWGVHPPYKGQGAHLEIASPRGEKVIFGEGFVLGEVPLDETLQKEFLDHVEWDSDWPSFNRSSSFSRGSPKRKRAVGVQREAWYIEAEEKEPKPLYVCRHLLNVDEFLEWATEQGFEETLEPGDLHVTQLYSKSPVEWGTFEPKTDELVIEGGPREVHPLGDEGAIVLRFNAHPMQERHKEFLEGGGSHGYDSYKPHVTLTYEPGDLDISQVEAYTGPLVFGPEEFNEIQKDAV